MDLDDGGVDHGVFHVRFFRAGLEKPNENIGFDPTTISREGAVPLAEEGRQIAPRAPSPHDPQNRFDKQAIVTSASSGVRRLARPRRRGLPKDTGERAAVSDNLLDRAFEASAPNQRWIADFTYIWTAEGWLYVAAVVDLFSRRVVGWAMKAEMTAQLVADALIMAIWRRGKPDSLLHHSDQGSQYTSEQFQRLMADHGITCSMSRSGNVWDNAAMESFFSSLKTERTARKVYRTRDDARADVFDYIERFYNPRRRHSTLGYLSPIEFEEQAMLA